MQGHGQLGLEAALAISFQTGYPRVTELVGDIGDFLANVLGQTSLSGLNQEGGQKLG